MARGIDFKQKEVININDGKILGFVIDVQADFEKEWSPGKVECPQSPSQQRQPADCERR